MNPYGEQLGNRDPLAVLTETPQRIRELVSRLGEEGFERTYAPGKWTAREIIAHLAQVEMMFGTRFRQALTLENYVVQTFDQDHWMAREPVLDGKAATEALCAMRQWNLGFFHSLSAEERARTFSHPERGIQSVDWMLGLLAGHDLNHLGQLEEIASAPSQTQS
jgi:uncharacterized damage-inducible protein DinB